MVLIILSLFNIDEFDSVVDFFDSTGALSAFEARHLLAIVKTMVKTNVRVNPTRLGHLWESVFFLCLFELEIDLTAGK